MRIAVTGASGFIGRYVLAELSRHSNSIVAVTRDASSLIDIEYPIDVIEMDISHYKSDFFERMGRPDVLIHLAWDGLPNYNSLHHFEIELPRQYQFLKGMIESGLESLVVTGTCFEYGMQSGELDPDLETKPNNPYGYAKDALRKQLKYLKKEHNFILNWVRLFYMYGEGQSKTSIFSMLQEAVHRGDKVFNMSGGEQLRDYLHVSQVAKQLVQLVLLKRDFGIANICSGSPISLRRLVEQWKMENNWNIDLKLGHYPYPDYEPMAFWGSKNV